MLIDPNKTKFNSKPANAPKFLIIGAQKAGTTALYEYLARHPQLVGTPPKELHYFNCDNRYFKGFDFYHSHFPVVGKEQMTFDASPGYLINDFAPERIYNYNSQIKLIAIIRDPIKRAYSAWNMYKNRYKANRNWFFDEWVPYCNNQYIHFVKRNDDFLFDFTGFIVEELSHLEESPSHVLESPVISHGLYHDQLKRYISLFNRDQLMVIENEEFRKDTIKHLRKIEKFIGIDKYDWGKEELKPVFVGDYEDAVMDDEARTLLTNYYETHNEKLFNLLGIRY